MPDIHDRFREQLEGKIPKPPPRTLGDKPLFKISLNKKQRGTIYIVLIAVLLVLFGFWNHNHNQLKKAEAIKMEREKWIDLRFRESVAHLDSICKWENENQELLNKLEAALKFKPYVQIREKYIDLSLPDAIHAFDSANYPQ